MILPGDIFCYEPEQEMPGFYLVLTDAQPHDFMKELKLHQLADARNLSRILGETPMAMHSFMEKIS